MSTVAVAAPSASPQPNLMTADEFTKRYEHIHAELVKGVVKEYPVPWPKHGKVCLKIGHLLCSYLDAHDVGHAMSNDSWIRTHRNPDTVRGADVCYFSYERLPKGEVPEGLLDAVPDLVVEVRSPSDRWTEIFTKVGEYLRIGVRVVIVLDPASETASVYRDNELQQIFHNSDELTIPDVLPGLSIATHRLFA